MVKDIYGARKVWKVIMDFRKKVFYKAGAVILAGVMIFGGCATSEEEKAGETADASVFDLIKHRDKIIEDGKNGSWETGSTGEASEGSNGEESVFEEASNSESASGETEAAETGSGKIGAAGSAEASGQGAAGSATSQGAAGATAEPTGNILIFRDVYGVEYETVIREDVTPIRHDKTAFSIRNGQMAYDKGSYLLGVDVSHHQGDIDWNRVKAAGYDFAILRIGYRGYGQTGSVNKDKTFEENYEEATAAGLKVGVYFFAQAINEAEAAEEAKFVLDTLNGRGLDLPVVYDPESILDDDARTDNVSGEQFTANTLTFCKYIEANGYEPMIYANMLWEAFELDLGQLTDYPIWYADYEAIPQTPYDFEIWQYTNEGSVDGISGVADENIWILRE